MSSLSKRHMKKAIARMEDSRVGHDADMYITLGMYLAEVALANNTIDPYCKKRLTRREADVQALCRVGLSGREEMNYLHLSEGQKQLCILARTLVSESRLLLLDEPESALDFRFRYHMLDLLRRWTMGNLRSAIVTLHDPVLALNCCDQLLLLENGSISDILRPATDSLEQMEEALSRIYGRISLQRLSSHSGREHLVMLKEDES